jgi:hypothetical protein
MLNQVLYHASFFETFSFQIMGILLCLGLSIFVIMQIKNDTLYRRHSFRKDTEEVKQTIGYKIAAIWLKFSTILMILAAIFMSSVIVHDYVKGPRNLTFKVHSKKIEIRSNKGHKSYTYKVDSDKYPDRFFEVNEGVYAKIKEGQCYTFSYYGFLSYIGSLDTIKEIREARNCN